MATEEEKKTENKDDNDDNTRNTTTTDHHRHSWQPSSQLHAPISYTPNHPNFYISGSSNEQLNVYIYPYQTLYTHESLIVHLSSDLTVEHLPCIELPYANNNDDYYSNPSHAMSHGYAMFKSAATLTRSSNFYNKTIAVNNDCTSASDLPLICLSPSLPHSLCQRISFRNAMPMLSSSNTLSRKILSINLKQQNDGGSLIVNMCSLFAYIISNGQNFQSPIGGYKLKHDTTSQRVRRRGGGNDNMGFVDLIQTMLGRQPPNNSESPNQNNNNLSEHIRIRNKMRKKQRSILRKRIEYERRKGRVCCGVCNCLSFFKYSALMVLSVLFPALFTLILLNSAVQTMSYKYKLPISKSMSFVKLQIPKTADQCIIFLESNGDIFHKYLGANEVFWMRGQCLIAFDCHLSVLLSEYSLDLSGGSGDFVKVTGPGHLWYGGNACQDLLTNCAKMNCLMFCDNSKYVSDGFGFIQSFEFRKNEKSNLVIAIGITLVFILVSLFVTSFYVQEIYQFVVDITNQYVPI